MLEILDDIEELKTVPDKLEAQISQKLFLSAHETLSQALRKADNDDLSSISALQPIHSYLISQESSFFSILIEELHNHIYLKSPYCDSRWNIYTQENEDFTNKEQALEDKIKFELSEKSSTFSGSALLDDFLKNFDGSEPLVEDPKKNSEADSFYYIRLIVESLANLNRLPSAFDLIHQRLPTELHKLVDKTIEEVNQRYPQNVRDIRGSKSSQVSILEQGFPTADIRLAVLKDLTWTLYSKLIAVLQAHRVIYEVVRGVSGRRGNDQDKDLLQYDFYGVFRIVQSEIRSLLYSYIADKSNNNPSGGGRPISRHQDMLDHNAGSGLSSSGSRRGRDKKRSIFKYSGVDYDKDDLQAEFKTLRSTLTHTVPGLVSNAYSKSEDQVPTPFAPTDLSTSHQLLVTPNVFNIRVMLDPTVMFLQKAKAVFPQADRDKRETDTFLEDFLVNAFLPQLEDTLSFSFRRAMSNPDSALVDIQWNKVSKKPILKGANSFINLVRKTCRLLNTGYLYREKYANLIITTIQWLIRYMKDHLDILVAGQEEEASTGNNKPKKLSYLMALNKSVRAISTSMLKGNPNPLSQDIQEKIGQEIAIYMNKRYSQRGNSPGITRADLLDLNTFQSICLLATSLRWIIHHLKNMRKVNNDEQGEASTATTTSDANGNDEQASYDTQLKKRWTLMEISRKTPVDYSEKDSESLILKGVPLKKFDEEINELEHLADTCVIALRCDMRIRTLYYVDRTMNEGDYLLDNETDERDVFIGHLDSDCVKCDEHMGEYLLQSDKDFVLTGLARMINELMIYDADSLEVINANGVQKMQCNILVLQQMLKSIVSDPKQVDFTRAIKFYELAGWSPVSLIDTIKNGGVNLSYEEDRLVLRLANSETIHKHESAGRRDAASVNKNILNEQLVQLYDYFYGSDKSQKTEKAQK